ncbi:MAG: hypothetical protein ACOCOI_07745, partial [Prevotella sp.]
IFPSSHKKTEINFVIIRFSAIFAILFLTITITKAIESHTYDEKSPNVDYATNNGSHYFCAESRTFHIGIENGKGS